MKGKHVLEKCQILRHAYLSSEGWRAIVDDGDAGNHCTPCEIFTIQQKAKYLFVLLSLAFEFYDTTTWLHFNAAVVSPICVSDHNGEVDSDEDVSNDNNNKMKEFKIQDPLTLAVWFRSFHTTNTFQNPATSRIGRKKIPLLFQKNPDLYDAFNCYIRQHLDSLSTSSIHQWLFEKGLPEIVKTINEEQEEGEEDVSINSLLAESGLKCLTTATIQQWMHRLGFKYEGRKKTYYVDSHEKPENVAYRSSFLERYFLYEIRAYRWLSLSLEESNKLVEDKQMSDCVGYKYTQVENDGSTNTYVEYHVDDHPTFLEKCSNLQFG